MKNRKDDIFKNRKDDIFKKGTWKKHEKVSKKWGGGGN
jgi:hypothetical protein